MTSGANGEDFNCMTSTGPECGLFVMQTMLRQDRQPCVKGGCFGEELCMSLIDGFCQCSTILFGEVSNFLTGYKLKCNYPVGVFFL